MLKDYDLQGYYSDDELAAMFGDDEDQEETLFEVDHPSLSAAERNPNLCKS